MKDTEFVFAVSYIKTFENKMLSRSDIEALIGAPDYDTAVRLLGDKGYDVSGGKDTDKILKKEQESVWKVVLEVSNEDTPLDILKYKNDFHNLKTILKAFLTNAEWESLMLTPSVAEPEKLYDAVKRADFSDLPDFIRETAKEGYRIVTAEHDGQALELFVDKMTYKAMQDAAKGCEFLEKWVRLNIDFANISIALRASGKSREFVENAMIPSDGADYSKLLDASLEGIDAVADTVSGMGYADGAEKISDGFGEFEKWCDNKKMEFLKTAKGSFFGFEPIMAYLLGKEAELQAVRIILSGHKNDIPTEIIRERLRDMYV